MIQRYHAKTETEDPTISLLETITKDIFDAVNARDFEAQVWDRVSPSLKSKVRWFTKLYGFQGNNKQDFVNVLRRFTSEYPEHEWYARTITSTIYYKQHYAEVFVLSENDGFPPGLIRQGICRFEYRHQQDHWLLAEYEILSGVMPGLD